MKSVILTLASASILSAPIFSHAESTGPVTRASVREELAQLEKAGYNPAHSDPNYTESLRAAQARISAQQEKNGSSVSPNR
ncbi:DUF4148 domain-containing protein [Paraburkholderia sp. IW21]|uniref:DUF4148 domain-containing protein n=1 Tax=Paraburkholderia sp. IW21 TaxID=3242488 RepID=UPI00351FEAC5